MEFIDTFIYLSALVAVLGVLFMAYHGWGGLRSKNQPPPQEDRDPVAAFPQRRSFERKILALNSVPHYVVMATMDRFEQLFDALGYSLGEQMMQETGKRLTEVARLYGGEVFHLDGRHLAVVYKQSAKEPQVESAVKALLIHIRKPFEIEHHEISVSLSVGMALYPKDGRVPGDLLDHAGVALCDVRRAGGDGYAAYSSSSVRPPSPQSAGGLIITHIFFV